MHTAYACMHPNVYWADTEPNWIGLDWTGLAKVESRQGGKQTTKMAAAGSRDLGLATYILVSVG